MAGFWSLCILTRAYDSEFCDRKGFPYNFILKIKNPDKNPAIQILKSKVTYMNNYLEIYDKTIVFVIVQNLMESKLKISRVLIRLGKSIGKIEMTVSFFISCIILSLECFPVFDFIIVFFYSDKSWKIEWMNEARFNLTLFAHNRCWVNLFPFYFKTAWKITFYWITGICNACYPNC